MRIYFNGAAHDVTGSQYLLEVNGEKLLVDCGLYQGPDAYERNVVFKFNPRSLDAVILTHAHIDHSGNLPTLVKNGYRGKIYATPATADLADIMLIDSGHIQEDDAEYINKRRLRGGEMPIKPLYTSADGAKVRRHFAPVAYHQSFSPVRGVTARLFDAGHILGSAGVCLDIEEAERAPYRLWFSGDIGRLNLPLLKDPEVPQRADYLVMECTYGDIVHPNPEQAYQLLREVITRTIQRGGKVIIPAFSVGRTQELVYNLNRMFSSGVLPRVPVYVDSPLAANATRVFARHPELFDEETAEFVRSGRHPALSFNQLQFTDSVDESKAINQINQPIIIISASGMAQNGRILHHLKHNLGDDRNTILIVGWQSPGTNGRELVSGAKQIEIYGEEYEVRAEVVNINGFSAHAGQDFLLEYALATHETLKKVILVHGDPDAAEIFADLLRRRGIQEVVIPQLYQALDI